MARNIASKNVTANQALVSNDHEMGNEENDSPSRYKNVSPFGVEEASTVKQSGQDDHIRTAHKIDHDPWYQVGLLLTTGFNCGYILGFSNLVMKPLGWIWGSIGLAVFAGLSLYANWLLAKLHIIEGKRFIRYRDLMGYAFGKQMYYVTWTLQFLTFILGNMGFLLLAGRALKDLSKFCKICRCMYECIKFSKIMPSHRMELEQIYIELNRSSTMTLQEFIIISGVVYFSFAFLVPNLSAMRVWCGISACLTFVYIVILMAISIKDGRSNSKNYKIYGTTQQKVFNAFNAIAAIVFMSNSGMLPEIQATLRQPSTKNMHKALYTQFSIGLSIYYGVTIIGYWAYGSSVSEYLLHELSGPKWAKILANATVFLQTIISQHMFCAPVHETLDTRFSHLEEKEYSLHNISMRFIMRALFFTLNTFVAAMLPFLGDFVNLMGSLSLIPLTFVFPSLIWLKVKGKTSNLLEKVWHWMNVFIFSCLTIAATTSALHLIVDNAKTYSLFSNS